MGFGHPRATRKCASGAELFWHVFGESTLVWCFSGDEVHGSGRTDLFGFRKPSRGYGESAWRVFVLTLPLFWKSTNALNSDICFLNRLTRVTKESRKFNRRSLELMRSCPSLPVCLCRLEEEREFHGASFLAHLRGTRLARYIQHFPSVQARGGPENKSVGGFSACREILIVF
ncbi:hypothetical protein TRVL_05412 [Trypanosoma vivax]|nr:hypothetical protein TRVL_05412 [Trypanosoma vivax]